jgi:hypothetical protein
MSMGRHSLLAGIALSVGALLGGGATPAAQLIEKAAVRPQQPRQNKRGQVFGGDDDVHTTSTRRRARHGWSNRHVQRMAAKKKNQARHRRSCKGRA